MVLFYKLLPRCYKWNQKNYHWYVQVLWMFLLVLISFSIAFNVMKPKVLSGFTLDWDISCAVLLFLGPKSHIWLLRYHDNTIGLYSKYIFPILDSKTLQKPQIFQWWPWKTHVNIFRTIKLFWDNKVSEWNALQKCWIRSLGKMFVQLHESGAGWERWDNRRRYKQYAEVEVNRG